MYRNKTRSPTLAVVLTLRHHFSASKFPYFLIGISPTTIMGGRFSGSLLFATGILLGRVSAVPSSSCPHAELGQRFDYVIIGGGTAGLVLANRLTEDPATMVAVIEAGTFPESVHGNWTQVPLYAGNFYNNEDPMMWPFITTPQTVGCFYISGYETESHTNWTSFIGAA